MTARQLVGSMQANKLDEERAVATFKLPIDAIREAVAYVGSNKELLETESKIEQLMLERGEKRIARGPRSVP